MMRSTVLSPCRTYRYVLWREWNPANPAFALFIGLNPSTADEVDDDPTIRRCVAFAKRWGYGALGMANLFAFRATQPAVLKAQAEPVGPENDRWLLELASTAHVIVAAWGVHGSHRGRDHAVEALLGGRLSCLKLTRDGHPGHPLYLPGTLSPVPLHLARAGLPQATA